jgi:hypothetical protein
MFLGSITEETQQPDVNRFMTTVQLGVDHVEIRMSTAVGGKMIVEQEYLRMAKNEGFQTKLPSESLLKMINIYRPTYNERRMKVFVNRSLGQYFDLRTR